MINFKKNGIILGLSVGLCTLASSSQTPIFSNHGYMSVSEGTNISTLYNFKNDNGSVFVNDGEFYVYGDIENKGNLGYTSGKDTGTIHLVGSNLQKINVPSPIDVYNLKLSSTYSVANGSPSFIVSNLSDVNGGVNVFGNVNFENGILATLGYGTSVLSSPGLNTQENSLIDGKFYVQEGASSNSGTSSSYVDGYVIKVNENDKTAQDDFEYSIGNRGNYRANFIGAAKKNFDLASNYVNQDLSTKLGVNFSNGSGVRLVDNAEYWEVINDNTSTAGQDVPMALLQLTWDPSTTPADIISDVKKIGIVRLNTDTNKWEALPNPMVDEVSNQVGAIIQKMGIYTLAKVDVDVDNLIVYNDITPNEDGLNDRLEIEGYDTSLPNSLEIYNRWAVKVYETSNYGRNGNFFKGYSEGRATLSKSEPLPTGTYFYVFKYKTPSGEEKEKVGYLYIN